MSAAASQICRSIWLRAAIGIVVLAAGVYLLGRFDLRDSVVTMFQWFDGLGPWGPLAFMAVLAAVVVFVLPGIVFTVGAGVVFGALWGFVYVVIATTAGAAVAFHIGRWGLGKRSRRWLLNKPRLRFVVEHFVDKGWKVILLTRLTPLFPFKLSNYVMGMTDFRFRDFLIGTFFGIMPLSFLNVYLGTITADLATLPVNRWSPVRLIGQGVGLLAAVILLTYLSRIARQALRQYERRQNPTK